MALSMSPSKRSRGLQESRLQQWWQSVDRLTLGLLFLLIAIGVVLSLAASPAATARISSSLDSFHFLKRHLIFLIPTLVVLIGTSMLSPKGALRLAALVFVVALLGVAATLLFGDAAKGATRWIRLGSFTLQPSEFLKPSFAVLAGWLFAESSRTPGVPAKQVSFILCALVATMLALQPDWGMLSLVVSVWIVQFFLAGLAWVYVFSFMGLGIGGLFVGYLTNSHVANRINSFLEPDKNDTYQVDKAIQAISGGGPLGRGPGEGIVKHYIPDSHTDFIFAVAGEEYGLPMTLLLVAVFSAIVLRGMMRLRQERDSFTMLASAGLMVQFGLQAFINMGVNLRLLPNKGMTLPFVSYGGSSMLAVALGMGLYLALTRTAKPHVEQLTRPQIRRRR